MNKKNIAEIKIGKRAIGAGNPVFIVAELSANHLQKFDNAVKLIKAAKDAGADAIKMQTYTPDTITIDCDNEYFQIKQGTVWDGTTFFKLYQKAYTPWDWLPRLQKEAQKLGMEFFSSVFDKTSADFMEKMNVAAYKIASFEITDIPLIEYVAAKKKPIIIAAGIASLPEIKGVIAACKRSGNRRISMLKCTSAYPASPEDMNLKTIQDMGKKLGVVVGLSDHTMGIYAPIAAVALGAKIVEKHFTLSRADGGADAVFSLEPGEFKAMVIGIRNTEKALGEISYKLSAKMEKNREFCRSLFVAEDIEAGENFTEKNVRSIRPGYGMLPKYLPKVIGKKASKKIGRGTPLKWNLIK